MHPHWQDPPLTHTHTHPILLPHRRGLATPDVQLWLWLASRTKPPGMTHSLWFNAAVNRASEGDARMLSACDWYSRSLCRYISLWNSSFPCRRHLWGSASGCGIPGAQQPIWSSNKTECVWNNSHFSWRWLTVIQMGKKVEMKSTERHLNSPPMQMYTWSILLLSSAPLKLPTTEIRLLKVNMICHGFRCSCLEIKISFYSV